VVFPAFFRELKPGKPAQEVLLEGEVTCFFHPRKRAELPCDLCGRFLCALCDLDLDGRHVCPTCLETSRRSGTITELEHRRFIPAHAALTFALVPILIWPITILTAPVAIYYSVRAFRSPGSLVRSGRFRAAIALALAAVQLLAWVLLLGNLYFHSP
jgi:hypothetical protein